jgi:hypothetical protein
MFYVMRSGDLGRIFPTSELRKFSARQLNFVAKLLTNLFIWKTKSSCYYLDTFALRKQSRMSFAGMCYAHACDFKDKAELLFELLKDELNIECSTEKGRLTEPTTIRNNLAHGRCFRYLNSHPAFRPSEK